MQKIIKMKFLALSLFIIAFSVSAYSQGYNVPSSMQQQAYNNQQISYNQRPQNFQVQQPQQQLNQNMFLQNNAEAVTPQRLTRSQELARRYAYNSHLVNAGNNYMQPMNNSYSTIDRLSVNQSRIMQASQYILANPVQTDFFLQSLLGINTQKISTENIKNIATRGDKFNLTRELIWLSQNRFIIESGQFNDARYSLKTIEKDKELADKQPGFFSTNTLLVGGGAILAGAGAALALGGGGGGSSASTDTGSPISLPEVNNSGPAYLACDYTSNYFNVDECAKCHDNSSTDPFACLNPSSTSSPSISSSSPFNMEIASALATPMNNGSCAPNMDPVQCLFCVNLSFLNFPRCTGQVVNYCTGNQYNSPWLCNHCSNPANTNTWICGGAGSVGGSSSSTSSTSSSSTSSSSGSTSSSSSSGSTSTSSSSSSSGSTSSSSSGGLFGDIRFGRQEIPIARTEAQVKNQAFMTANANYLNVSKFDAAHRRNLTGKNINFFVWDWFAGTQQANISKLTGLIPTSNIKGGLFNPNGDSHSANISWRGSSGWKHGQTVAGVLAQGAYEGNFYFVSTFSGSNLTSGANYINNIGGARGVVNMSFGGGFTPKSTLVTASGNYKHFLVMAAGNNSAPNPSMPAAWADQAGFNNGWYAVVATNPAGTSIASYSNRCGNTYSCFAMPAGVGGGTGLPGTSYAAPAFAAVVGVMAQAYPNLTNGQISRILAQTANDIGATGWDSTFGFGIPNLERALNPNASATYFANGSGQNVSFAGTPSYVSVNTIQSAFGSALGTPEGFSSEGEGMSVMMIDDLDRYFQMQSPVQVRNAREDIINKYTNFINPEIRSLKLNETKITETFSVKFDNNSMANLSTENTEMLLNELPITALTSFKVSKDVEATFGYTANLNNLFSNPNLAYEATDFITPEDFSNPYLGFIENIQSTASQMSFNLSDNLSARATGFTSDNNFGLEFAGSVLELNYKPTDNLFIGFKQGFLQENNSLFGVQTSGAFDFANNSNTMFTGLDLNYDVNSKWSLFASGFAGISSTSPAQNSAFSQVSDVITSAFNLGLSRKEIFGNDKLIMAFGQPLRVESGTARGTTLTMDEGGVVNQTSFAQTLAPNARALKIHTSYAKEIAEETDIIVSGEAVRNANHMTNNELDLTILGRVRHGF